MTKNIREPLFGYLLLCLTLVLTGCGGFLGAKGPASSIVTYFFETPAPKPGARTSMNPKLVSLRMPSSYVVFDTNKMAYMERDHEIKYFAYSSWVARPSEMLGPLMIRDLEATGHFTVSTNPSGVQTDFDLHAEILDIYQDLRERPSIVRVAIKVALIESATRNLLGTKTFAETETVTSDDAYGGVIAVNKALARILEQLVDFMIVNVKKQAEVLKTDSIQTTPTCTPERGPSAKY